MEGRSLCKQTVHLYFVTMQPYLSQQKEHRTTSYNMGGSTEKTAGELSVKKN